MNDDDVLKCYSQMLARLPSSYVMPHMLQTQRLDGRCMYFERTRTSSVQTNCICMLVFFLSGSETGCKGNGDVLHATSLHLEFRTC
jgi:hypothetical protein